MGDINFENSPVSAGRDVNIVQIDKIIDRSLISGGSKEEALSELKTLFASGDVQLIAAGVEQLSPVVASRADLDESDIAAAAQDELATAPQDLWQSLLDKLATIGVGAASGVLAQGVTLGLRTLIGI